ncbi:MAG TPA: MFS transporter, partial [Elusimicrobiota bacterium]|nr:MFS transporter [Elusimicrobiota bacterium]
MSEPNGNTAPNSDRVPPFQKIAYGLGALTNNLLAGAFGNMSIILNLGLGMNPATIGNIMACSKFTDAVADPIMGYVSDHSHTRWGRRRPYIVLGALLSGLVFALMWQIHSGRSQNFYFWSFLLGTNIFYLSYTIFAAPFIGLGYEMSADYNERTRIQGYANFIGQIPWLVLGWCFAFTNYKPLFHDTVEGSRFLAVVIGIVVIVIGVLPGIICKEPYYSIAQSEQRETVEKRESLWEGLQRHIAGFLKGFKITLKNSRFLKLAAATFLVFNGFMLISGLGSYVIIFYVFRGDQTGGARYMGMFSTALSLCTFGAIAATTWLATKMGKKQAFILSQALAIAGYVLKWFCYRPGSPLWLLLPAPLIAFGLGGLFTTVCSMIADVCDQDELDNGFRREATFGAIYWLMVKIGNAAAFALSGHLLNFTGFLQELGSNQSPK